MDPDDHKVMDGDRYSDTFQDVMQDMQNLDISESHSGEAFRLSGNQAAILIKNYNKF